MGCVAGSRERETDLPRRERREDDDLSRGIDRFSRFYSSENSLPRRQPALCNVINSLQELLPRQRTRSLELGVQNGIVAVFVPSRVEPSNPRGQVRSIAIERLTLVGGDSVVNPVERFDKVGVDFWVELFDRWVRDGEREDGCEDL